MSRTKKEIEQLIIPIIRTETNYRKWERRLELAITEEEKNKCKYKMKEYKNEQ